MCELYGVTRGGYYAWRQRGESLRSKQDKVILKDIEEIFQESRGTYGSPRIFQALRKRGWKLGEKRVARIMRENGIRARAQKIYKRCPEVHKHFVRVPNHQLGKEVKEPNQVWVGDITFLRAARKWHYLAVVMDRWSRRIVGWSLGSEKSTSLTFRALENAVRKRKPQPGIVFHSDRGSEYLSKFFQAKAKELGFVTSSNRPKKMTDNAHIESFFHSLKSDEYHGRRFTTVDELRRMVESYIPFYNQKRIHSGLGYRSPVQFERCMC